MTIKNKLLRILITTYINYTTKFITPYSSIVIQRSLRDIIKAIISLYLSTRTN